MDRIPERRRLELDLPAEPRIVRRVRQRLEEFVRPYRWPEALVDDLKLAISEACSNAICHGSPRGRAGRIRVRFELQGDTLTLEVTDQGAGFRPTTIDLPAPDGWQPSGRGLYLLGILMDGLEFESANPGTRVILRKRVPPPASGAEVGGWAPTLSFEAAVIRAPR